MATDFHSPTRGAYLQVPSSKQCLEISEESSSYVTSNGSRSSIPKVSSFASINIFKDGEIFLQKSVKRCNGVLLQGPLKLMRLCLFGFILPALLISVPLYVRLILYPPFHYMMAPTDQRLLDHTSSSVWCQGQSVHMNGSFNAFLMPETPRMKQHFSTHHMLQHMTLKDDVKEYWGFFLQRGSIISINLCNRYDGGILMIMRGVHNLKKCAWVGEEDSAEQDEDHKDSSNESGQAPELSHDFPMVPGEMIMVTETKEPMSAIPGIRSTERVNLTSEERKEELDFYINQVLKLSKNRREIVESLKKYRLRLRLSRKIPAVNTLLKRAEGKLEPQSEKKMGIRERRKLRKSLQKDKLQRVKRYLENDAENEEGEELDVVDTQQLSIRNSVYLNALNSSYEVSNATKELYLSLFNLPNGLTYERGKINQTASHDTSDEEHRSSFSSSEEALTKCEGLIGIMPLYPSWCHSFNDSHTNKIRYRIPLTGTYYFVFSSDNEVFNSDVYFNMTLQRVVFDTEASKESCVNKTDCSLAFSFWSHDQALVEVPEGDWNAAYTMEIKCQPRVAVYLFFLFLIPVFILMCAFH